MVSKKGKRKIKFNENIFYWYVRKKHEGNPIIHILSEDKRVYLELSPFDTELPVTPKEIRKILKIF